MPLFPVLIAHDTEDPVAPISDMRLSEAGATPHRPIRALDIPGAKQAAKQATLRLFKRYAGQLIDSIHEVAQLST